MNCIDPVKVVVFLILGSIPETRCLKMSVAVLRVCIRQNTRASNEAKTNHVKRKSSAHTNIFVCS